MVQYASVGKVVELVRSIGGETVMPGRANCTYPHHFIPSPTTASDNSFQSNDEKRAATQLLYAAG